MKNNKTNNKETACSCISKAHFWGGGGWGGALGMHLVCCHQEVSDKYVA